MIKLYSMDSKLFNNNGDQGNLEVLQAILMDQAVEFSTTEFLEDADFALIGDCSIGVLEHRRSELDALVTALLARKERGQATLIVGRPFEYLAEKLGIELQLGKRESQFVEANSNTMKAFGYHNSEVVSPRLWNHGAFIGTTLFGPLLGKNPEVLKAVLLSLGLNATGNVFAEGALIAQKVRDQTTFE